MSSKSVAVRIVGPVVCLAILAIGLSTFAVWIIHRTQDQIRLLGSADARALFGERVNHLVTAAVMESRGIYMSPTQAAAEPFAKRVISNLDALKGLMQEWRIQILAEDDALFADTARSVEQFVAFRTELVRLAREDSVAAARAYGDNDANRNVRMQLSQRLAELAAHNRDYLARLQASIVESAATARWTLLGISIGGTILVLAAALTIVIGGVTRPLRQMTAAMAALAGGDTGVEVPSRDRGDEIGAMSRAVQVFKENAVEKRRLEETQALARAAKTRRQEEVDQLVGFFGRGVGGVLQSLAETSAAMSRTSTTLENSADTTESQANSVTGEVERTASTIQTVAAASQQLSASIGEIGRQASESARGSTAAMQQADHVVAKVGELRQAAEQIGTVVQFINGIAGQTNLLALNATIEAARAGEAGRGFAVVAGEVKALANQTAQATQDIARQVTSIQAATAAAADAIQGVSGIVRAVNETAVAIATAVEQQSAATQEIGRSIEHVTASAASVARSMEQVRDAVGVTTGNATEVKRTAAAVSVEAESLSAEVKEFLAALHDLGEDRQMQTLEVDLAASAVIAGETTAGRILKLSPGVALFAGRLPEIAVGTLTELRVAGLDRPLRGRFVGRSDAGCQIQLLLNHDHLAFMERTLTQLAATA